MSASSERIFSKVGDMVTRNWNRLQPGTFKMLAILKARDLVVYEESTVCDVAEGAKSTSDNNTDKENEKQDEDGELEAITIEDSDTSEDDDEALETSTQTLTKMAGAGPKAYMGWWGSMGSPTQKYVTSYTVSPYATRPLKGALYNSVFNVFRRTKNQIAYVVIPGIVFWNIWAVARDYNEYLYTKAGREDLEKANA